MQSVAAEAESGEQLRGMEQMQFAEGAVREFLLFRGFSATLHSFEAELHSDVSSGFQVSSPRGTNFRARNSSTGTTCGGDWNAQKMSADSKFTSLFLVLVGGVDRTLGFRWIRRRCLDWIITRTGCCLVFAFQVELYLYFAGVMKILWLFNNFSAGFIRWDYGVIGDLQTSFHSGWVLCFRSSEWVGAVFGL